MKTCILAALVAATIAVPALSQSRPAPAAPATVEEPIPADAPPGSSNPVVGGGVALIVIAIGLIALSSMAFLGPAN